MSRIAMLAILLAPAVASAHPGHPGHESMTWAVIALPVAAALGAFALLRSSRRARR